MMIVLALEINISVGSRLPAVPEDLVKSEKKKLFSAVSVEKRELKAELTLLQAKDSYDL